MAKHAYLKIDKLLRLIDEPNRTKCESLIYHNYNLFKESYGSVHNHQSWVGGYLDHITEVMNLGRILYLTIATGTSRPLNFSLSDVLLILFLHDIEKPWKYEPDTAGTLQIVKELQDKDAQHKFQEEQIAFWGIELTPAQQNALHYVEGEYRDYSPNKRVVNELGALCHMADIASARIFYDYPLAKDDPWTGAKRCTGS